MSCLVLSASLDYILYGFTTIITVIEFSRMIPLLKIGLCTERFQLINNYQDLCFITNIG